MIQEPKEPETKGGEAFTCTPRKHPTPKRGDTECLPIEEASDG